MKKNSGKKIRLGIFVVFSTVLLIAALYFIGNRQNLFGSNISLYANFTNVNGLQNGNNVRFSGIDVGTVNRIRITEDTIILVEMLIRESQATHIRRSSVATIGSDGLVGNMVVNILPRGTDSRLVQSGDTIDSYSRIGTADMLTTLNVTNENAALLTADLLKITNSILKGKGTVSLLINDSLVAQDLKQTMTELRRTSTSAALAMAELKQLIASIDNNESVAGLLLTDSLMGRKVQDMLVNLESSSVDIRKITTNLDSIVGEIKNGDGALNYLAQDEALVKNIDTTVVNIKESVQKFNENMDALRSNWLFRGYFKKLERQQRKAERKEADKNN
jgi:phospholipid/cholesterol/gamma-HCH transport system substrate-binding protein